MAHRRLAARQSMVRQTNPDPLVVYRHIVSKLACAVCAVLSRTPVLPLPELEDCRFFAAPGRVAWVEPTQLSTSEDGRQFSWARAAMLFVASRWRPAARPSSTLSHQADTLRKRPRQAIISDAPDFLRGSAFAGAERGSFLPGSASRSEQLSVRFSNLPNPVLLHLSRRRRNLDSSSWKPCSSRRNLCDSVKHKRGFMLEEGIVCDARQHCLMSGSTSAHYSDSN